MFQYECNHVYMHMILEKSEVCKKHIFTSRNPNIEAFNEVVAYQRQITYHMLFRLITTWRNSVSLKFLACMIAEYKKKLCLTAGFLCVCINLGYIFKNVQTFSFFCVACVAVCLHWCIHPCTTIDNNGTKSIHGADVVYSWYTHASHVSLQYSAVKFMKTRWIILISCRSMFC